MGLGFMADKELAAVGVRASIGHAQTAGLVLVGVALGLVFEGIARSPGACAVRAAPLSDESRNNAMEC